MVGVRLQDFAVGILLVLRGIIERGAASASGDVADPVSLTSLVEVVVAGEHHGHAELLEQRDQMLLQIPYGFLGRQAILVELSVRTGGVCRMVAYEVPLALTAAPQQWAKPRRIDISQALLPVLCYWQPDSSSRPDGAAEVTPTASAKRMLCTHGQLRPQNSCVREVWPR